GVLFSLVHVEQGRPMGQIAAIFGVDPSVITYRVKRLEAMGCVTRTRPSTDRRLTHAVCTATGRARLRQARPVMLDSARRHFLSHLSPDDRPAVTSLFTALLADQQQGRAGA
ncbi:MAG TPA: MarR family winged helix-turn-helix transcriptional regulator, partial [Pseudonocardia sp.]